MPHPTRAVLGILLLVLTSAGCTVRANRFPDPRTTPSVPGETRLVHTRTIPAGGESVSGRLGLKEDCLVFDGALLTVPPGTTATGQVVAFPDGPPVLADGDPVGLVGTRHQLTDTDPPGFDQADLRTLRVCARLVDSLEYWTVQGLADTVPGS